MKTKFAMSEIEIFDEMKKLGSKMHDFFMIFFPSNLSISSVRIFFYLKLSANDLQVLGIICIKYKKIIFSVVVKRQDQAQVIHFLCHPIVLALERSL